jgi:ubiquinone biosynthesis protein
MGISQVGSLPAAGVLDMVGRIARIAGILAVRVVRLGWSTVMAVVTRRSTAECFADWLVDTVTDLGPAFVKVAQMLSTRADLVPPRICRALSGLYDAVRPIPDSALVPLLERRFGRNTAIAVAARGAVAAGSIACVYRVELPDGRDVAVKVRRPGIERVLRTDLAILRGLSRLVVRLRPFRGVPVVEIVEQVTESVYGQLDLVKETENLDDFHRDLAGIDGVRVPRVYRDLCTDDMVVMEFVGSLRRYRPEELPEDVRTRAVMSALHGIYQMLFYDGLVHCDLHPGNLYLCPDGTVVLLDAGFCVRLRTDAQDKFASFFYQMSTGRGDRCAEIVLSTATAGPDTDVDGFRDELRELVDASTGVSAGAFDLVKFAARLFDIQRRYGLYADPQFVFPILSLLVLEGTVRDFAPDIDFQEEAMPFLIQGTLERAVRGWQATLASEKA